MEPAQSLALPLTRAEAASASPRCGTHSRKGVRLAPGQRRPLPDQASLCTLSRRQGRLSDVAPTPLLPASRWPRCTYWGKSDLSTEMQLQALKPQHIPNQSRNCRNTWEKPNSLRAPAPAPWVLPCDKAIMSTEHRKNPGLYLALALALPTPALPPIKVVAASTLWGKMQPVFTSDPALPSSHGTHTEYTGMIPHKDIPSILDR